MSKTMTESDVEKVMEVINSLDSEEDKLLASLPSNNNVLESDQSIEPVTETATVSVDTCTGANNVMNKREEENQDIPDTELEIDAELQKMLSLDADDVYKVPESLSEIEIDDSMLMKSAEDNGIKPEDMTALIPLINKYRNGEKVNWYNQFPQNLKRMIDKMCLEINNTSKDAKNLFAAEVLDGIVRDAKMDRIVIDMQESIQKAYDISPLMEMVLDQQRTLFEDKLLNAIKSLEAKKETSDNPEIVENKIKQLNGIIDAYKESYLCEDLVATIKKGKIRVKNFDISKYTRYCREFCHKYEGDTPFVIHDVSRCLPVLVRKLGDKYTPDQLTAAIIAFIKYSQNKSSKDVIDHTYMSYFVSNIINLDIISTKTEQEAFSSILIDNIEKVVRAINNLD